MNFWKIFVKKSRQKKGTNFRFKKIDKKKAKSKKKGVKKKAHGVYIFVFISARQFSKEQNMCD